MHSFEKRLQLLGDFVSMTPLGTSAHKPTESTPPKKSSSPITKGSRLNTKADPCPTLVSSHLAPRANQHYALQSRRRGAMKMRCVVVRRLSSTRLSLRCSSFAASAEDYRICLTACRQRRRKAKDPRTEIPNDRHAIRVAHWELIDFLVRM